MKAETEKALRESIEHWRRFAKGVPKIYETPEASSCPLCNRFGHQCMRLDGEKCPVFLNAGIYGCKSTPWASAFSQWSSACPRSPMFLAAAKIELDYLESLLPKKSVKPKRVRPKITAEEVANLLLTKKFGQKKLLKLRTLIKAGL